MEVIGCNLPLYLVLPGKEISSEKAKNELNWQPSTSFEDGVNSYINWYKEYKL